MLYNIFFLITLNIFLSASGCVKNNTCPDAKNGIIKDYAGLDGCKWIIELENGDKLEPTNLEKFELNVKDGQKVKLTYKAKQDMMSVCMVGNIIEITCISAE